MIHPQLLKTLVCPENHVPLQLADERLLGRLNQAIAAGSLKNRAGKTIEKPLHGGLVREDQAVLYPILDDIPVLLINEGILLTS